jgi:hypothetical protein
MIITSRLSKRPGNTSRATYPISYITPCMPFTLGVARLLVSSLIRSKLSNRISSPSNISMETSSSLNKYLKRKKS